MKIPITSRISFRALIAASVVGLLTTLPITAQSWYNASWPYRFALSVVNEGGTVLTDFQVKIILNTENFVFFRAQSDGSDIRFTDSDGTTLLPYWIENWIPSTSATVWVKVPHIPATGKTLYLYYGNSSAFSASNGTATFMFFDDFSTYEAVGEPGWIRSLNYAGQDWSNIEEHDWKYSIECQEGSLYYSIIRAQNGWTIESLDEQIKLEFDYIDDYINQDGTIEGIGESDLIYKYGAVLSTLALGYLYFKDSDPALALRTYHDMVNVYGYVKNTWPVPVSQGEAYSLPLRGFDNAWKAFIAYGNNVLADEVKNIIINYVNYFTQSSGGWIPYGVQDHLKRDFAVLLAFDVTRDPVYLQKVRNDIDWILLNRWVPLTGGLTWTPAETTEFYECHQQWFMIAVRMLYNRSGGAYNYLDEGEAAWHFLTDNPLAHIDLYVHNHVNNDAFFSYRQVWEDGDFQSSNFKGSYEIGAALWGMSLNYDWVSHYKSSYSPEAYNYLDEMIKDIKRSFAQKGFFSNGINHPNSSLWNVVGTPIARIVEEQGNMVLSMHGRAGAGHNEFLTTIGQDFGNFVLETRIKLQEDLNNLCSPEVHFRYTDINNRYLTQFRGETENDLLIKKYYNGASYINKSPSYDFSADHYYKYKIRANGNSVTYYLDDWQFSPFDEGPPVVTGGFCLLNYGPSYAVYFDDVFVRGYAATEPSVTVLTGNERVIWTGSVSTNWSTNGNWSTGVRPVSTDEVTIPNTTAAPVIDNTTAAVCNNLTIDPSGCLTIAAGGALTVNSTFTNNGTLNLNSDANGTASLLTDSPVTVNMQLYLTGGGNSWHYISSPVSGVAVESTFFTSDDPTWDLAQFVENIPINLYPGNPTYNWQMSWVGYDGWSYFNGNDLGTYNDEETNGLRVGKGYIFWDEGSDTYTFSGEINTSNPNLVLTVTDRGDDNIEGFNLIGNPFTCGLDIQQMFEAGWPTSAIYQAVYFTHDGTYYVYGNDVTVPSAEETEQYQIPPMQGFFVKAIVASDISSIPWVKVHTSEPRLKGDKESIPLIRLSVSANGKSGETVVRFNEKAKAGADTEFDAPKFLADPGSPSVYTSLAGMDYIINGLPFPETSFEIPVTIKLLAEGSHTISVVELQELGNYKVTLTDKLTSSAIDLKSVTEYKFSEVAGLIKDRFVLTVTNLSSGTESPAHAESKFNIYFSKDFINIQTLSEEWDGEKGSIDLIDMTGRTINIDHNVEFWKNSLIQIPLKGLKGVLFVRIRSGLMTYAGKVM